MELLQGTLIMLLCLLCNNNIISIILYTLCTLTATYDWIKDLARFLQQ